MRVNYKNVALALLLGSQIASGIVIWRMGQVIAMQREAIKQMVFFILAGCPANF